MSLEVTEDQSSRYPVDYDLLKKGDVISAEICEGVLGVKRDHQYYALRLLGFKEQVEREMMSRRRPVTIKCEDCCLRILTDEEASEYNAKAWEISIRRAARSHARNMAVDVSQLSEERRTGHERTLYMNSRLLQAMARERKVLAIEPHKRQTPTLSGSQ